jgi:O-6-methylguanine DNA methyltransferase
MIQVFTQTVNDIWFAIACAEQQVVATSFAGTEQKVLNNLLSLLPLNVPFQVMPSLSIYAKNVFVLMANIFEGKDAVCDFSFVMDKLPKYTILVLNAVMQIPLGHVSTYGAVANAVGGGPRAVGNIMASNLFAPLIPCHRVVKSDFSLGGYGGGLKTKYQLLTKEKRGYTEPKNVTIKNGDVLQIYPVEMTLDKSSKFFNFIL